MDKASLDTNVILHLYRSASEHIVLRRFSGGIYVHEFIRKTEMQRHGQDILAKFDTDVASGKIHVIDDTYLKSIGMYSSFCAYLRDEQILYNPQDLGEVYAISLARTLGVSALVTDDVKERGPHYTLMRMPDGEIIPFAFYEILFLDYLEGIRSAEDTADLFRHICHTSDYDWRLSSKLSFFVRRFWKNPYTEREAKWMKDFCRQHDIHPIEKLQELRKYADG